MIFSPVAGSNKPFIAREKIMSRQISIGLSLIYITIIYVMLNSEIVSAHVILESFTVAVIFMIAGYIKYKKAF
ncbi:MAG: hypothetical protein LUI05_01185 [Oscillospiraceae bacterium]|nr:hypothetical protein [Oscillospiraceae bacterium]